MNFKNGDLALVIGGPWKESIGLVVKIIRQCRTTFGRGVRADGLHYWMSADGPVYLVRPMSHTTMPAGTYAGKVLHQLKRRPVCGCHLRPLQQDETEMRNACHALAHAECKTS